MKNNKSLGQHWLKDRLMLEAIVNAAELKKDSVVLEIGPGLGTLTSELLRQAKQVIAVEFDEALASKLSGQFPGKDLTVHHGDILSFDLETLPKNYSAVANVPYYITSKIVQALLTATNKPKIAVLLVQKEVAQRIAATPGDMSMLALSAQVYAKTSLGVEVDRSYFTPPPEVDSQVIVLKTRQEPLIAINEQADFFRIARAGFGEKRKKLRSSLSGGLHISKPEVDEILTAVGIPPEARAQELSIEQWHQLTDYIVKRKPSSAS